MSELDNIRQASRAAGDHELAAEFDALAEAVRYAGDQLVRALVSRGLFYLGPRGITETAAGELDRLAAIARRSI